MSALSPSDCDSIIDIMSLKTSCVVAGDFHMMLQHDQAVIIYKQRKGEKSSESITIPKRTFLKFLNWYHEKQS